MSAYNGGWAYQQDIFPDGFASNVTSVTFNGWVKAESASPAGSGTMTFEVGYWNGSAFAAGGYYNQTLNNTGTTTWQDLSVSLPVSHGAVEANCISVTLRDANSSYAVYFDDVSVR